jgi:hypothetical protein
MHLHRIALMGPEYVDAESMVGRYRGVGRAGDDDTAGGRSLV